MRNEQRTMLLCEGWRCWCRAIVDLRATEKYIEEVLWKNRIDS